MYMFSTFGNGFGEGPFFMANIVSDFTNSPLWMGTKSHGGKRETTGGTKQQSAVSVGAGSHLLL